MPATWIALVLGIVAGQAEECIFRFDLCRQTTCPDVLVIIVVTRRKVIAEPATAEARDCAAQFQRTVAYRRARRDDTIRLIITAVRAAYLQHGIITQPLRHIFNRATNGVASIKRALWSTQHFDPFDVVDIQHRSLWTVEIHVVQIKAHARFEPGNRILLTHATDEGRQCRIGAARSFESDIRGRIGNVGDVDGTGALQRVPGDRGYCNRDIQKAFFATPCRNNDAAVVIRNTRFLRNDRGRQDAATCHRRQSQCTNGRNTNGMTQSHHVILSLKAPCL